MDPCCWAFDFPLRRRGTGRRARRFHSVGAPAYPSSATLPGFDRLPTCHLPAAAGSSTPRVLVLLRPLSAPLPAHVPVNLEACPQSTSARAVRGRAARSPRPRVPVERLTMLGLPVGYPQADPAGRAATRARVIHRSVHRVVIRDHAGGDRQPDQRPSRRRTMPTTSLISADPQHHGQAEVAAADHRPRPSAARPPPAGSACRSPGSMTTTSRPATAAPSAATRHPAERTHDRAQPDPAHPGPQQPGGGDGGGQVRDRVADHHPGAGEARREGRKSTTCTSDPQRDHRNVDQCRGAGVRQRVEGEGEELADRERHQCRSRRPAARSRWPSRCPR